MIGFRFASLLLAVGLIGTNAGLASEASAAKAKPAARAAGKSKTPAAVGTKTAVLEVTGMTWGGCQAAVQQALSTAKGVKKAAVSLDRKEARVTYDPKQTNPQKLVSVVKQTHGMAAYSASVKKA